MAQIPTGQNADFYMGGRFLARYKGARPPSPATSPIGSPAWWRDEGIRDVFQGVPSRTGQEAMGTDAQGNPAPVTFGSPAGDPKYPAPNPQNVRIPGWADDYWTGYLWALQDPGTAAQRLAQGGAFSAELQKGNADGLARRAPQDPRGLVPTPAQLTQLPPGLVLPTAQGGINVRPAPPAPPPKGGGIWVNPPGPGPAWVPLPVAVTYEIYGRERGRIIPYSQVVRFSRGQYQVISGDSLLVSNSPSDGFGYGGHPGRWSETTDKSPMDYGLDSDKGVVAWNGRRAYPVPSYELLQLFGPSWKSLVYR